MAELHVIEADLAEAEKTAPPAWVSVRIGTLNEATVVHSGGGELAELGVVLVFARRTNRGLIS